MRYNKTIRNIRNLIIVIILVLLGFGAVYVDYCWTKSSLEDLTGKEVKPGTVIWTMMKTGNKE